MEASLVRQAFNAYCAGNYALALRIYQDLDAKLGRGLFSLNIELCEKYIPKDRLTRNYERIPLEELKVACIMDDFTFTSYAPECQLHHLSPQGGPRELQDFHPDLLFVESAWHGQDGLWSRKINHPGQELKDVLDWCRMNAVPTMFWNKEDPVHYTTFLSTAQLFDHVFTTDIDCIAQYKAALGHERIYLLPFACQPKLQNPIEHFQRKDAFCFAGAYYVRYPERTRDLENYIESLPEYRPLEIFDRNFGKEDGNYKFPEKFTPFIVGNLPYDEIDKAYKGYRYAINLNSIKNSQSMFARRVYELLASNTIAVSNYSRGMRLMFGELVLASDNGKEIIRKLEKMDDTAARKHRLAGLRKVLLEHTYEHRLAYIAGKVLGRGGTPFLPLMVCVGLATTPDDAQWIMDCYKRQQHVEKRLFLVLGEKMESANVKERPSEVTILSLKEAEGLPLDSVAEPAAWLAFLSSQDYYGPHYLLDIALTSKYSDYSAAGKICHYQWTSNELLPAPSDTAYRIHQKLPYRCGAVAANALPGSLSLAHFLENAANMEKDGPCLSVDPFNFCLNGRKAEDMDRMRSVVDEQPLPDGMSIHKLHNIAEAIPPALYDTSAVPQWDGERLLKIFEGRASAHIQFAKSLEGMTIQSSLKDGTHEYIYSNVDISLSSLPFNKKILCFLACSPGLHLLYVFVFFDSDKQKVSHVILESNINHVIPIPEHAFFVRFGIRAYGPGICTVKALLLDHRNMEPDAVLHGSDIVVLTNQYPEYGNLYRNAFVHSRVKAYRERGVCVDVFRLHASDLVSYYEFEGVDVISGNANALRKLLTAGPCSTVLVHFLDRGMWDVLKDFPDIKIIVWVHGVEIQPWTRREFNYRTEMERSKARKASEQRMMFWRKLLLSPPPNLTLVFVSRHIAEEVMEDLGYKLPASLYVIIHNPIDTELFAYHAKDPEQRKKILSIRPYASATYANDLSVEAIKILTKEVWFEDLELRMIGEGPLFKDVLKPVRHLPNVICEQRFLTRHEIAALHQEYGVFLTPTRMDSQGISRDEAMSSGLVPVTNAVAAVPEFVDDTCGFLTDSEDAEGLASAIKTLYLNPDLFMQMSDAAANRVRRQSSSSKIIQKEIALFMFDKLIAGER